MPVRAQRLFAALCVLLLVLAFGTASAAPSPTIRQIVAGGGTVDPHVHYQGIVRGSRVVGTSIGRGNVRAGLEAIGLDGRLHKRVPNLVRAVRMTSLGGHDHTGAYGRIEKYTEAAFPGRRYDHVVGGAMRWLSRNADVSFVQITTDDHKVERFITAAKNQGHDLKHVRLLLGVNRNKGDAPSKAKVAEIHRLMRAHPDQVVGIDLLGFEETRVDPAMIHAITDVVTAVDRPDAVLRIHAGETHEGNRTHDAVKDNVNIVLATLRERADAGKKMPREVILGHATRITDVKSAARDLKALRKHGVDVIVNPCPESNLAYDVVHESMHDVTELVKQDPDVVVVVGSDNIGSRRSNERKWRSLLKDEH